MLNERLVVVARDVSSTGIAFLRAALGAFNPLLRWTSRRDARGPIGRDGTLEQCRKRSRQAIGGELLAVFFCTGLTIFSAASGVHASEARSARVMPRDAASGDPSELMRLAQRYDYALGVDQDFPKANLLYCRAAKAGDPEAQFRLGWIYASGRGVPRDDGIAAVLFAMAAKQGHEHAARRLQHVRTKPGTALPPCLQPDRVMASMPVTKPPREIEALVRQLAPQYSIDPHLVMAVISVESGFNANAVSPRNAQGLMQLIPETAQRFGVKKAFNPTDNIKGGLAYLRWLMAFFQGEVKLVLAAYNAGERAVERYNGIPPYAETQNYVQRITSMYAKLTHPYSAEVVAPSPMMSALRKGGT